jgi:hypothetical protein
MTPASFIASARSGLSRKPAAAATSGNCMKARMSVDPSALAGARVRVTEVAPAARRFGSSAS